MINHIHELLFCGIGVLYSFKCIERCLLLSNELVFCLQSPALFIVCNWKDVLGFGTFKFQGCHYPLGVFAIPRVFNLLMFTVCDWRGLNWMADYCSQSQGCNKCLHCAKISAKCECSAELKVPADVLSVVTFTSPSVISTVNWLSWGSTCDYYCDPPLLSSCHRKSLMIYCCWQATDPPGIMYGWCTKCRDKYPEEYTWVVFIFILRVGLILILEATSIFHSVSCSDFPCSNLTGNNCTYCGGSIEDNYPPAGELDHQDHPLYHPSISQAEVNLINKTNLCIIPFQLLTHQDHPIYHQLSAKLRWTWSTRPTFVSSFLNYLLTKIIFYIINYPTAGIPGRSVLKIHFFHWIGPKNDSIQNSIQKKIQNIHWKKYSFNRVQNIH